VTRLRLALAAVGMTLALVGALREDRWLVWAAIAAMAAALILRIAGTRRGPVDPP